MTDAKHTAPDKTAFDVIIVGSGMVGALLANALADSHLSIAIVDKRPPAANWDAEHFDTRVSAITHASQHILEAVGIWDIVKTMRTSPFREMHVWDATGNGVIHFDSAEIGVSCLGHIVENNAILSALMKRLGQYNNITPFFGHQPLTLINGEQTSQLRLEHHGTLTGKLIVGADGANSWVRESSDISISVKDYQQTAVVTTVKTEKPHQETAWQRFMPTGPVAFLPLTKGYSSIVWSTTPEHASTLLKMTEHNFRLALGDALDHKLGTIIDSSELASFPLKSQHVTHYVKPRIALIGDAAHTIHPLAGQGANLGFADAAALAEVLLDSINIPAHGKIADVSNDIGNYGVLRRYERWRKGENLAMLTTMSAFKTLFGNQQPLLRTLRNMGLNLINNVTPAKNVIIRQAMGLTGDLPKLARHQPK